MTETDLQQPRFLSIFPGKHVYLGAISLYTKPIFPIYSPHLCQTQNGRHFADDIFKFIFLYENCCILIKISLKFVPISPASNKPTLE